MTTSRQIVGRYAPSPTGELHLGNLRTAMLAWLKARLDGGEFILRMEDLDQPRVVSGSADQILRDLEWMGLDWDGPVLYQSSRTDAYLDVLRMFEAQELVYPCFCSRKDIQMATSAPHSKTSVYPGTCQQLTPDLVRHNRLKKTPAMRIRVSKELSDVGDFVVQRADSLFAYQLAVVVDDLHQKVTQVVRGADLLDSMSRQIFLANAIEPNTPQMDYFHVPLMCDSSGDRLSKRDGSASLKLWRAEGKSSDQLIAYLFNSLGVKNVGESLSLNDLYLWSKRELFHEWKS